MYKKVVAIAAGVAFSLAAGQSMAGTRVESTTVTCADLNWSAEVLAQNPDIGAMCQTVYEKDGSLLAKVSIVVTRIRGNRMTFRPIHTDGTRGASRSVNLSNDWRANIAGREFRLRDLTAGQELNVYMPQDRFALTIGDDHEADHDMLVIEEPAEETVMPTTASPLFLIGLAGGGFLALGGLLTRLRRRA